VIAKKAGMIIIKGTGTLISADVVLTVAHNICKVVAGSAIKKTFTEIEFYRGQHGNLREFYEVEATYFP
jgi:hypothetical protein